MNICIVGTGYVGLTTGVCLAYLGHKVTCLDLDGEKLGHRLLRHEEQLPSLKTAHLAIIGIGDGADAVREALYPLSFSFGNLEIADLGNARKEDNSFLIPIIRELLESKIIPVLIGHSGRLVQAQFEAHHASQAASASAFGLSAAAIRSSSSALGQQLPSSPVVFMPARARLPRLPDRRLPW